MVNKGPNEQNNPEWYPQLPDGYESQQRHGRPPAHPAYGGPQQSGFPQWQQPGQWGNQPGQWGNQPGPPGFPPGQGGFNPSPPGFPPGQWGQQPGRPPGQQQGNQAPTSAPPNRTPEYPSAQLFAVDPGAIRGCMYRFTYVWLSRRQGFWFYPVFVGRTSVAGYRWNNRRHRWSYTGIDLNNIDQFTCF